MSNKKAATTIEQQTTVDTAENTTVATPKKSTATPKKTSTKGTTTTPVKKSTTPKKATPKKTSTPNQEQQEQVQPSIESVESVDMHSVEQTTIVDTPVQEQEQEQVVESVDMPNQQQVVEAPVNQEQQVATESTEDVIARSLSVDLINTINALPITPIMLADIKQDEKKYQPRVSSIDKSHVALLQDSDMENWTPIVVTPNPYGGYDLVDGYHRYEAASRKGALTIAARVLPAKYLTKDASIVAAMINVSHGLTLTKKDRKELVKRLYAEQPTLSTRTLGKLAGVSHETARTIITPKKATLKDKTSKQEQQQEQQEQDTETTVPTTPTPTTNPLEDALYEAAIALKTLADTTMRFNFTADYSSEVVDVMVEVMGKEGYDLNRVADTIETYRNVFSTWLSKFDTFEGD